MNNNLKEAERWLSQSENDLKVAQWDLTGKFWSEVCFKSQQTVEKALKAYRYARGERAILGHSLLELSRRCIEYDKEFFEFIPVFRKLDKYYVITRYPNGLPGLTPAEFFTEDEASQALTQAKDVVEFVKRKLKELKEKT